MAQKIFTLSEDFDITGYETELEKDEDVALKVGGGTKISNGVDFNFASSQYVSTAIKPFTVFGGNAQPFSLEGWIYLDSLSGQTYVSFMNASNGAPRFWFLISATGMRVGIGAVNAVAATGAISLGAWHHLVITYDGTTLTIYIDNPVTPYSSASWAGQAFPDTDLMIGTDPTHALYLWDGLMDEVRIYDTCLDAAAAAAHYNSGIGQHGEAGDPGLIAGYHFNETAGVTADNYEGTAAFDGTLVNMGDENWIEGKVKVPYADDSPQAKLIEVGQTYSLYAGSDKALYFTGFSDTTVGTGNAKYRWKKDNDGSWPAAGWSNWLTEAEFNAVCANGDLDGKQYIYAESQLNSDGLQPLAIPDATFDYTAETVVDYTEVSIPGEGTATETFSYTPDYVAVSDEKFSGIEQRFEKGYSQTFPRFRKTRREFKLKFLARTETDKDGILAFVNARVGGEEAFWFLPEDETANVKVYIKSDSIRVAKVSPGIYNISFDVEELY